MRINDVISQLVSAFDSWDGFLKDPNFVRNELSISWQAQERIFASEFVTRRDVLALSHRRQYSFRVSEDDSILQIAYRFASNEQLVEARLAYFEVGLPFTNEVEDEHSTTPVLDDQDDRLVRWLRIDFNRNDSNQPLHTSCHLHLSGHPETRLAVRGVPTPTQFVELVAAYFYPQSYALFRLDPDGAFENMQKMDAINSLTTNCGTEPADLLRRIPHLLTPGF